MNRINYSDRKQLNELEDYVKVPQYSTEETTTSVITSLPSTVVNGELKAEISGRTISGLSINKMRILSEGKNIDTGGIVDGEFYNTATGAIDTSPTRSRNSNTIKVDASTEYVIKAYDIASATGLYIYYYEEDGTFISAKETALTEHSFTTPANCMYINWSMIFDAGNLNTLGSKIQIELGATATAYEEYTKTQAKCPVVLRDVPNGVADTFDFNTGEYVKRVEEYELIEDDITTLDTTSFSNIDLVRVTKSSFTGGLALNTTTVTEWLRVIGYTEYTGIDNDSTDNIGKFSVIITPTLLDFYVAKGTYADLNAAKTALAGTKIISELATPITTNYFPSVLQAKANGRFIQEPFIDEQNIYASGIAIDDTDYPIANLVFVNKKNLETGALTPISLSSVTVAGNGLSFTITGAVNDEVYTYGYNYSTALTTQGSIAYSYNTNVKAQMDSNTEQIKKIGTSVYTFRQGQIADNILFDARLTIIEAEVEDMFKEQESVAVTLNATTTETDILNLNDADTRYILRNLSLKCVDPGVDTVTIRLYGLVNDALTLIDTFDITTANYTTYFKLMDMFGIKDFAGDEIKVTVEADANSYAITGQYSYAKTV